MLVRDPVRGALQNGKEVSSLAGVHPTSAMRLARRLGFRGYPEFRAFLQEKLIERGEDFQHASARIAARLVQAEEKGLLSSLVDGEIDALRQIHNNASDEEIRNFSLALRDARRIYVFGFGHCVALANLIFRRLSRSGYSVEDLSEKNHELPERMISMTSEDVVWLIGFRRPNKEMLRIRKIAKKFEARTLALTDLAGARFNIPPELHITVSRGEPGQSQSLVVPMTIVNAVILDLAAIDEGKTMRSLENFKILRAELASDS